MQREFWHKQTTTTPLFGELLWSRPENRIHAGKLLIVGGNAHGFAAPAESYGEAMRAGIGTAHALLPEAIRKIVGVIIENADYAPSTPSGSFATKALGELIDQALWADSVLFAGDLGRNSETAILIEKFLGKYPHAVTLTKDGVDYATSAAASVLPRPDTLLVLSFAQLQRLATAAKSTQPLAYSMDMLRLVDWLHDFSLSHAPYVIVKHLDSIFVAVNGQVSSTRLYEDAKFWRIKVASHASVWWLQNHAKPFEALTTGVYAAMGGSKAAGSNW